MILDTVLVSVSLHFIFVLISESLYVYLLFRLGIYRIPADEAIVTITTVGLEVVLIVMLDEMEPPLSALVVYYTCLFASRM